MKNRHEKDLSPLEIRMLCREGKFTGTTAGFAAGYAQANLVILPKSLSADFLLFCQRNPKPCPILEVTGAGEPEPHSTAPGADVRTDLPHYRVFRNGKLEHETGDVCSYWQDDLVTFIIGCSFTFERALQEAGIPVRHIEEGRNVPMFRTTIPCAPVGCFSGPLVVSMRPMSQLQAKQAVQITSRYPNAHGAPVHIGSPSALGIKNLNTPDYGEPVTVRDDEVPVFWACGVTPQEIIVRAKPHLAITHAPGCMFVTDLKDEK